MSGLYAKNTSGVRGVTWAASKRQWRVRVKHRQTIEGGYFDDLEDAAAAARALRLRLFTHNVLDRRSEPND